MTVLRLQRGDLSRLRDSEGRPPGLIGWWPSHATTFLENHDTVRPAAFLAGANGVAAAAGLCVSPPATYGTQVQV